jgi:hypothetical protein
MIKSRRNIERRLGEKAVIGRVARGVRKPAQSGERTVHSPVTSTGLPVQDQLRKRWSHRNGGLPQFLLAEVPIPGRRDRR